jgi:hypothetical protein
VALFRSVTPALHRLDHAIGRLSTRRDVLVELRTPVYHAVLAPIADALASEKDVHLWYTSEAPDRVKHLVPEGFLTHVERNGAGSICTSTLTRGLRRACAAARIG